jgi:hypothetical protein
MKFKAIIEDPWLSQKYEFEIESDKIAAVSEQAAERALIWDEKLDKLSTEYRLAIDQKRRDMAILSIKQKTTVVLVP